MCDVCLQARAVRPCLIDENFEAFVCARCRKELSAQCEVELLPE